jgi:hypothetical protein
MPFAAGICGMPLPITFEVAGAFPEVELPELLEVPVLLPEPLLARLPEPAVPDDPPPGFELDPLEVEGLLPVLPVGEFDDPPPMSVVPVADCLPPSV